MSKLWRSPLVTLALLAGGIYLLVSVAMERPSPGAFVAEVLAMAALCNVAYWLGYRAALAGVWKRASAAAEQLPPEAASLDRVNNELALRGWPLLAPLKGLDGRRNQKAGPAVDLPVDVDAGAIEARNSAEGTGRYDF